MKLTPAVRTGIAFGGGSVRGMAHVGALSVLLEAGIRIDYVSGVSAGSIMGALFCAGLDIAEIEYVAEKISWRVLARPVWSRKGLLSFAPLEDAIRRLLGDITFADLEIPLAVVATDMETGDEVVIREGPLAPAIHASCAVPGFVVPRRLDGRLLGDGGIVNNVPVSAARDQGADFVIGIDIFEPSFSRSWGPLGMGISAVELMISRAGGGSEQADCLIRPALCGVSYVFFADWRRLYQLGREAALAALPDLQAALRHQP